MLLGSEGFQRKTWEGAEEKVCTLLSEWKWLLPKLSYKGKVLVANNSGASTLWLRLILLMPPRALIEDFQKANPGPLLVWSLLDLGFNPLPASD